MIREGLRYITGIKKPVNINSENKNNENLDKQINNENLISENLISENLISEKEIIKIDKNYMEDGTDIKWADTVEFTFPIQGGRVIKVYDGDTITIASKLPFNDSPLYRLSVRLNGIDTPEIKGKNEDEKTAAKNARDSLSALILNKYVTLKNIQSEKYGRILADVYLDELWLNEWMIKERFAVKYDGGTKVAPSSWLKFHLTGELNII
jgi:endonuclease YncB( thermonuclease family)